MVSRNQLLMQIRNLHHHKLSIPQLKKSFSLIFGLFRNFQKYLCGKEFSLETNHWPLVYLCQSTVSNARLMKWALLLRPFRFRIMAIKGADCLSSLCFSIELRRYFSFVNSSDLY